MKSAPSSLYYLNKDEKENKDEKLGRKIRTIKK
jgi:hypothetical protein